MRTTLNLDDELLEKASRLTGIEERTALVREAMKALIERESARRLARLGERSRTCGPFPGGRANLLDPRRHIGVG